MIRLRTLGLLGAVAASISATASAADVKPEDAIEYRQSVFTVIKWNFAPIGAMVKGEKPFDANAVARHAEFLEMLSQMPLEGFAPGSDKGDTEAKADIWTDWNDFKTKMSNFQEQTAKLAEVAKSGNEAAIKEQFGATGKACKSCHDKYRKEK